MAGESNNDSKICPLLSQSAFHLQSTLSLMNPAPPGGMISFKPVACMKEKCEWWTKFYSGEDTAEGCAIRFLAMKKFK